MVLWHLACCADPGYPHARQQGSRYLYGDITDARQRNQHMMEFGGGISVTISRTLQCQI